MRKWTALIVAVLALGVLAGCKPATGHASSGPQTYTGWNPVPVVNGGGVAVRVGTTAGHVPEWLLAAAAGGAAGAAAGGALSGAQGTLLSAIESGVPGDPCKDEPQHRRIARWYVSKLRHGRQGRPYLDCQGLEVFSRRLIGPRPTAQQVIACLSAIFQRGEAEQAWGEIIWKSENAYVVVSVEGRIVQATPGPQGWEKCAAKA